MPRARCFKERKDVEVKDPKFVLNKIGRPMMTGTCADCGGKIFKLVKATDCPAELQAKMKAKKGAGPTKSRKSKASRKTASRKSKKSRGSAKKSRRSRKSRK